MQLSRVLGLTLVAALCVTGYSRDMRFGVQGTLSKLTNDFVYDSAPIGFGIGGHALVDIKDGHAVMPRLDFTHYQSSHYKLDVFTLGADYNYYFNRTTTRPGFYAGGGIGLAMQSFKDNYGSVHYSYNKTGLSWDLCGGYMFDKNMGAELRYVTAEGTYGSWSYTSAALNASFLYRF